MSFFCLFHDKLIKNKRFGFFICQGTSFYLFWLYLWNDKLLHILFKPALHAKDQRHWIGLTKTLINFKSLYKGLTCPRQKDDEQKHYINLHYQDQTVMVNKERQISDWFWK